jgi:hypothetical protein
LFFAVLDGSVTGFYAVGYNELGAGVDANCAKTLHAAPPV